MRPRHIAVANRESRVVELISLRLDATISRRRRPDEPFLHEGLCLFAGPADHLEGSLVQCVASLHLPSDPLLHRLEGHCGRLPGEDVDLIHRRHDVRFVEAFLLRDLREFLRGRDAHLVRDRARADVQCAAEDPGETKAVVDLVREVDRPVAITRAPASAASHGQISGTGFAMTNRMESSAIDATQSFWMTPGPGLEAAIVTSTARIASAIPPTRSPPFVMRASSHFSAYSFAATSTSSR